MVSIIQLQTAKLETPVITSPSPTITFERITLVKEYYDIPLTHAQQDWVKEICLAKSIEPALVYAIMKVESNYNVAAVSSTHDYGIMQLNRCHFEYFEQKYDIQNFLDFQSNVICATDVLAGALAHYNGKITPSLVAYNLGISGAHEFLEHHSSSSYSRKVLNELSNLKLVSQKIIFYKKEVL